MVIKNKNKIYIISFIFIAICVALILFLVLPFYKDIKNESYNLVSKRNNIFSLQEQINGLIKFNQNKNTLESDFVKANYMLVDSKNPVNFIEFLEKTAKNSGLTLNISLAPNIEQNAKNTAWKTLSFQLSCNGGFSGVLGFVNSLENAPYLISIQSLKIGKEKSINKNSLSDTKIQADFLIKVFAK